MQEEDWWKPGNDNERDRQIPMTISLTDRPIAVNGLNGENVSTLPTIANSPQNQHPQQQRNSSDDFEEELMGVRRWPSLIPGFQKKYESVIIVEDERNLRA